MFFRVKLPEMPYDIRPHLPDRADLFMQNSKRQYAPHDHIALLSDSYAAGIGDWLLVGGGLSDEPYHSANAIHDLTGRDVASFGRVNTGRAQAMFAQIEMPSSSISTKTATSTTIKPCSSTSSRETLALRAGR